MFEFLKRWFGNKPETPATDMDPVAAMALTTDTSDDAKLADISDDSSDADVGGDAGDADFDADL